MIKAELGLYRINSLQGWQCWRASDRRAGERRSRK
jgi:hypothetical protein